MLKNCMSYFLALVVTTIITTLGIQAPALAGGPGPEEDNPQEASNEAHTYVFRCDEGFEFVARTENRSAWLFLPSGTLKLMQESSDKYRSDKVVFRINGQSSRLERPGGKLLSCRNNQSLAIWQHAKLNGADFRAVGNEPGWYLEIHNQAKVILVTGYGTERHEFELPEPETNISAGKTDYRAVREGQEMTLTVSREVCRDSMSGEMFESKVDIAFEGKTLQGCGRALH